MPFAGKGENAGNQQKLSIELKSFCLFKCFQIGQAQNFVIW